MSNHQMIAVVKRGDVWSSYAVPEDSTLDWIDEFIKEVGECEVFVFAAPSSEMEPEEAAREFNEMGAGE